jgi:zinc transporter ZupT
MLKASIIRKSFLDGNETLGDILEKVAIKKTKAKDDESNKEEALLPKELKQGSELTPYILLIALSFHGLFEGIALGLSKDTQSTISLMIAILAHKWAESLTLGLSFTKAETKKSTFMKMIFIFASFTPIGIGWI